MKVHPLWLLAVSSALLFAGCSGDEAKLRVGREPDANGGRGGTSAAAGNGGLGGTSSLGVAGGNALTVAVEDIAQMEIKVITLACAGDCADVVAVASGGHPPYAIEWDDGSTGAMRRVCPSASTEYSVTATDTAIDSEEFPYAAQTAVAEVTATVLDCDDGGVTLDGGGDQPSVYWADWSTVTVGAPSTAMATVAPPGGDVTVRYAGEVAEGSATSGSPSVVGLPVGSATVTFEPMSTYQSASVSNGPPPSGLIGVDGDPPLTQTIAFSVPVRDPLIAVVSLGNFFAPTTWTFDSEPVVLSSGPGVFDQNGTLTAAGTVLTGAEGNGVAEFSGTFTSISFTVSATAAADFAAFTVGIRGRE